MIKIIILWATCRPITLLKTHSEWIKNADNPSVIETYLSVDTSEQAKMLPGFDVIVTDSKKAGVCYPSYCLSSRVNADDDDIVIFASDDFFPSKGWDTELKKKIDLGIPQVLVINDGIQKYPSNVVTIPVMNYSALKKMNWIIYNPTYNHLWSDVELYDVANSFGLIKDIRGDDPFCIEHRHYCNGKRVKDETDILINEKFKSDKELYLSRKKLSTEEKLCIPKTIVADALSVKEVRSDVDLSILVCTTTERKEFFKKLLDCLQKQIEFGVEVLSEEDEGNIPIGGKRNLLLSRARGKYCCFIDDDDLVSDNYIKNILDTIKSNPDCCSLVGEMTTDGQNPVKFVHSLKYKKWEDAKDETGKTVYYRCPNHLNVIKTDLCRKVLFNNEMSFGEDKDFSQRILPLLKQEAELENSTYFYLYRTKKEIPNPVKVSVPKVVSVIKKKPFIVNAPWRV